jgi:putative phosphoesterase
MGTRDRRLESSCPSSRLSDSDSSAGGGQDLSGFEARAVREPGKKGKNLLKIGLIADPHANLHGTQAVIAQLRDCDVLLCAGDLTGYFNFVNETVSLLRQNRALCVRGNHDQFLFDHSLPKNPVLAASATYTRGVISSGSLEFLGSLPLQFRLTLDDLRILVCHGSPWNLLQEYVYPDRPSFDDFAALDADIIVLGHTHRAMVRQLGQKLIINPGSCGQPRDGGPAARCATLDTRTLHVEMLQIPFDMDSACAAAVEVGLPLPYGNKGPGRSAEVIAK